MSNWYGDYIIAIIEQVQRGELANLTVRVGSDLRPYYYGETSRFAEERNYQLIFNYWYEGERLTRSIDIDKRIWCESKRTGRPVEILENDYCRILIVGREKGGVQIKPPKIAIFLKGENPR